jgi:hypothetical protein
MYSAHCKVAGLFMCFVCLCVNQEKFYKIANKQINQEIGLLCQQRCNVRSYQHYIAFQGITWRKEDGGGKKLERTMFKSE